jgi:signal transduction histidine kinase
MSIDAPQIEQVLLNVILNAIQASPQGSCVRVRERQNQHEAMVDVIDEGHGIPAEHLGHIFSPFCTTREKGTGLGLAIAHRIITTHNGQMEITQTSERGTCVRIRLPIGNSTQRSEVEARPQVHG